MKNKKILITLTILILLIIVSVSLTLIKLNQVKYDWQELPSVTTEIKEPLGLNNYNQIDGKKYYMDYSMRRIIVNENGQFQKVLFRNDLIENDSSMGDVGKVRSFSKVGNKIYMATVSKHALVFDTKDSKFSKIPIAAAFIAENKENNIVYYQNPDRQIMKLDGIKQELLETEFETFFTEMEVKGKSLYVLSKVNREIEKINIDFSKNQVDSLFKLPKNEIAVGMDINEDYLYFLTYETEEEINVIYKIDLTQGIQESERKEIPYKIIFGAIRVDENINLIDAEPNDLIVLSKSYELITNEDYKTLAEQFDFFDPRNIIPYKMGYLISSDERNKVYYVTCEKEGTSEKCNVQNEMSAFRPRQIDYDENMICVGTRNEGIKCFNHDFETIKHILSFNDKQLIQAKGVLITQDAIFVTEVQSGCLYKYTKDFQPINKICGLVEPRAVTTINGNILVGSPNAETVFIIDPETLEIKKEQLMLNHRTLRGVCFSSELDNLYSISKNDALYKSKLVNKETFEFSEPEKLIDLSKGFGCYLDNNILFVVDNGAHKILKYDTQKEEIIGEIFIESKNDLDRLK